jgi:hypothetical protein
MCHCSGVRSVALPYVLVMVNGAELCGSRTVAMGLWQWDCGSSSGRAEPRVCDGAQGSCRDRLLLENSTCRYCCTPLSSFGRADQQQIMGTNSEAAGRTSRSNFSKLHSAVLDVVCAQQLGRHITKSGLACWPDPDSPSSTAMKPAPVSPLPN